MYDNGDDGGGVWVLIIPYAWYYFLTVEDAVCTCALNLQYAAVHLCSNVYYSLYLKTCIHI
jgi:hypothetical protein